MLGPVSVLNGFKLQLSHYSSERKLISKNWKTYKYVRVEIFYSPIGISPDKRCTRTELHKTY